MNLKRGLFVVFEGNDCVGKTTQAKKLVEYLCQHGKSTEFISFPDRTTEIGSLINKYLVGEKQINDKSIHLLFTANRWERYNEMLSKLQSGKNLIVDRYSFSGVAYSAAKPGMNMDWCKAPESGLLKPDCVIFLASSVDVLERRQCFGKEVYEKSDFQDAVKNIYSLLNDNWNVCDFFADHILY